MTQPGSGSGEPRMTEAAAGPVSSAKQAPVSAGKPKTVAQKGRADTREARDTRLTSEREAEDREATQDREISEDERLELFRESLMQEMLPSIPPIPGYHVCWLSTTHKSDTLAFRIRLGYRLIRIEEVPGWDGTHLKTGDTAGVISCNEMVAAKIPLSLYNKYMREVHHVLPSGEEQKLKARVELMKQQAQEIGADVIEGDGNAELARARARPMPDLTA